MCINEICFELKLTLLKCTKILTFDLPNHLKDLNLFVNLTVS